VCVLAEAWTRGLTEEERRVLARARAVLERAQSARYAWQHRSPARAKAILSAYRSLAASRAEAADLLAKLCNFTETCAGNGLVPEPQAIDRLIAERDASRALVAEKDKALGMFVVAVHASEELRRELGEEPAPLVLATILRKDFEKPERALALTEADMRKRLEVRGGEAT